MARNNDDQSVFLRRILRTKRWQITGSDRFDKTAALINHISNHRAYKTAKHIAFYSAFDGEVDLSALLLHSYNNNKHCYLTVLPKFLGQRLRFAPYLGKKAEKINQFGISEPQFSAKTIRSALKIDLIFMPLVGFDKRGHRLGMGGGYYDRCLEFRRNRLFWKTPLLVGIAFECQKVGALIKNPWDVSMDACVTEKCVYEF